MSKKPINFYTMWGFCPPAVAMRNLHFAFRTFTASDDAELIKLRRSFLGLLSQKIGVPKRDGLVLNSGSEANEVAVLLGKQKTGRGVVLASNLVHSSVPNAVKKFGLKMKTLSVSPSTFQVSEPELVEFLKKHGKSVAMITAVYGTTQLGTSEDFILNKKIQELCRKNGIWVHIDAAFGAFYLNNGIVSTAWKKVFALADSITLDAYKIAGLPTSGVLLLKDPAYTALLGQEVTYFNGTTTALGTTRNALSVATSFELFTKMGSKGLQKLATEHNAKAEYLRQELKKQGKKLLVEGGSVIVAVKSSSKKALSNTMQTLTKNGFLVSAIKIEAPKYKIYGFRVATTTKPEMSLGNIKKFVAACKNI